MSIYYTNLIDLLTAAGVRCEVSSINAGWETRARSSGGFSAPPLAVFWHHTASSTSPANDLNFMINGHDDAPVGNMLLDRDGIVWPVAAGACNCAGKGGPNTLSRGTIPVDGGNTRGWHIEAANSGVGETWPQAQIDAYFTVSNTLNSHFGNCPDDVLTHALGSGVTGWTSRKIDPATTAAVQGPWRPSSVTSSGTWSLADIRAECWMRSAPDPIPTPEPPQEDDDMLRTVLVPTFPGGDNYPYLALFDSGVIRPLASFEPEPASGKHNLGDEGQYRTLCEWAGIKLG